jgi:ATP-dependent DNA ligase
MKKLPTLYKRTELGKIQEWTIVIEGNQYYSIEGIQGGKLTTNKPTAAVGLNVGKKNETTPEEQALKEAQAKWQKKCDAGYTIDVYNIDNSVTFFEPQLAKKYIDFKDEIKFPCLVSRKIDGSRLIITKDRLATRNGKDYKSCPHISNILKPLFIAHQKWVVDCEIYSHDIPFEKIMSLVRKTKPTPEDLIESEKIVKIYIFDGVIDNKNEGFAKRFDILKKEINNLIGKSKHIVFVDNYEVNSHEEIKKYHDQFVQEGFEGAMIRISDAPYQNKRSKNLLKLKSFNDDEFIIKDIIEGIGGRANMAGNLLLKMKDGRTFGAGIRGGEEYYKELLKNKNQLIGKQATIRYQELSKDGIPRFPVAINIARDE